MTRTEAFDALGVTFEVVRSSRLAAVLGGALVDLEATGAADHELRLERAGFRRWNVWWDDVLMSGPTDASTALYSALRTVNLRAAEHAARDRLVLHGACVEIDGVGVGYVGDSGAGKTSLAAASLRAGFPVVCEEAMALDTERQVLPFHRPLGVRRRTARWLELGWRPGPFRSVRPVPLSVLGTRSGDVKLELVVFPSWTEGPTEVTAVDPASALVRITNLTLGSAGREREAFRAAAQLVRRVPMYDLAMTDPAAGLAATVTLRGSKAGGRDAGSGNLETIPT